MIKIRQIKHSEEAIKYDYPKILNYPPKKMDEHYLWLETGVIHKAIRDGLHKDCSYFGIVAPKYRRKIEQCKNWGADLRNKRTPKFNPKKFESFAMNSKADIVSMTTHPKHSTFAFGDKFHPNISGIAQQLCDVIGFKHDVKTVDQKPIYFNYWVASPEICQAYFEEVLSPMMKVSSHNTLMADSKYVNPLPESLKRMGLRHWTYHPFIGERMINAFVTKHKLKVASF